MTPLPCSPSPSRPSCRTGWNRRLPRPIPSSRPGRPRWRRWSRPRWRSSWIARKREHGGMAVPRVYRVRAEADDPESLIEGRGRRRTVIPIGYRVGGTSIAGRADAPPESGGRSSSRRPRAGRAFVVASTGHPRMTPDFDGGYDVRGWGYIYALGFLLELRERELVEADAAPETEAAIRFYIDALERIEIPEVGGWNYARRGPRPSRCHQSVHDPARRPAAPRGRSPGLRCSRRHGRSGDGRPRCLGRGRTHRLRRSPEDD